MSWFSKIRFGTNARRVDDALLITLWHTSEPWGLMKNFPCPLQLLRGNFTKKITFSLAAFHTCICGIYKDTSLLIHEEASLPATRRGGKLLALETLEYWISLCT